MPGTLEDYIAAWLERQGGYADPAIAAAPLFYGTNEKDAQGAAVVRAEDYGPSVADAVTPSAWSKAQAIGAPRVGEHYVPASIGEILASDNPARLLAEYVVGAGRPASVAAQDPYGIGAWEQGKGPMPAMIGSTENVGGRAYGSLAKTLRQPNAEAEYALRGPTVQRVHGMTRIGDTLPRATWEGAQSEDLIRGFAGDQDAAHTYGRLWGATSPATDSISTTRESLMAQLWALEHPGQELTVEVAQRLPERVITMAPSKVPNINATLRGEALSGDKAEAMAAFMAGKDRLPIDVHTLYGVGSKATALDKEIPALRTLMTSAEGLPRSGGLTDTQIYMRYEDALKRALQEYAPNRDIKEVFGTFWRGTRAEKGLKPTGGPIDVLRKKGLLEMGAMLDPDRLRAVLKTAGWSGSALAGLLAMTHGAEAAGEGTD